VPSIFTVKSIVDIASPSGNAEVTDNIAAISPKAPTELAAKEPGGASNGGVRGASRVTDPVVTDTTSTPKAGAKGIAPRY
jgi:hypothetical protein